MEQYIKKSALVAEIENRIKSVNNDVKIGAIESLTISKTLNWFKSFLNTLEVKEVDLDKEIETCLKRHSMLVVGKKEFTDIAKHFFELGLQVAQKGE